MYITIFHNVRLLLAYELRAAIHIYTYSIDTAVMLTRPHYGAEVTY